MKIKCLAAGVFLAAIAFAGAATNDLTTVLQNGLFEEEANHNLDAAILAYQSVATQFDKDRKLAATAIFRLGECYRKRGDTNAANAQYRRILREFSDQPPLVTLSRQNLTSLGKVPAASGLEAGAGFTDAAAAQAEAAALKAQLARLKSMGPDISIAIQQELPNPVLTALMQKLTSAEQDLAAASAEYGPQHPDVRKAKTLVETVREQIDAQIKVILTSLEAKCKAAEARAAALAQAQPLRQREPGPGAEPVASTSTEAEEIKRVQAMIKDSPDLINAKDKGPGTFGFAPLHKAAQSGQLAVATFLLNNGAEVDLRNNSGETPLHLAAAQGHKAMVELLLSRGADVQAQADKYSNYTPLHLAAASGFRSLVELLLAHKAQVNAKADGGTTALHLAAVNGFKAVAEVLLKNGADVNATASDVRPADSTAASQGTPLHLAVARANQPLAELLLASNANVNAVDAAGETPLHLAAEAGQNGIATLLLAHGADPNARATTERKLGWTPLHNAVAARKPDMVALLLKHKADPDARIADNFRDVVQRGYTPLMMATTRGYPEVVDTLLAFKADPNLKSPDGRAAIFNVILNEYPLSVCKSMLAALLEHGADPNTEFTSDENGSKVHFHPLYSAVGRRYPELVELLLQHGADPDAPNRGFTPLLAAVMNQQKEIASLLLARKADPNIPDGSTWGAAPLHYALTQPSIVELLLAAKAEVNARTKIGETPLHWAAGAGLKAAAELLLAHGADPNARASDDVTPLHLAVLGNHAELVELLLANQADPNIRSRNGRTPLDFTKTYINYYQMRPASGIELVRPQTAWYDSPPSLPRVTGMTQGREGIQAALKSHGATEDLPDLFSIRIMRKGVPESPPVFKAQTNSFGQFPLSANRFTLMEALAHFYPSPTDQYGNLQTYSRPFAFPDFSRIRIHRPGRAQPGRQTELTINLLSGTNTLDCTKDVPLQFGDVVEIPEREHTLAERSIAFTPEQHKTLNACLERKVTFIVREQPTEIVLHGYPSDTFLSQAWKLEAVQAVLRSSSDFCRIRIKRLDPDTRKPAEFTANVQPIWENKEPLSNDVWLRNGDVVEVPDKPEAGN